MARFAVLEIAVVFAVVAMSWFAYRAYLNYRRKTNLTLEAFFSGGPLHEHTENVAEYTPTYTYTYNRPVLTKANAEGIREKVSSYRSALYEYQGGGIYMFKGETPIDKLMQYDLDDETTGG